MTVKDDFLRVPYAMTVHGEEEIEACVNVLRTSTQMGKHAREFEQRVAGRFGKTHGIFVNSGSSALYLAVEVLDLPKGSEVITPILTFATTVGCIVKNGLIPAFVDVEANTYNIDSSKVEAMITDKTSAMVIPNLMGNLPNWEELRALADKYNLKILEDSADIIGATYKGEPIGSYSDISISSFYGMHVINCAGNGGIVVTSNDEYARRLKVLRSWGRSSSVFVDSENIENRFNIDVDGIQYDAKFVFEEIGYNLEGAEIGAAFGLVQEAKLDQILKKRTEVSESQLEFFGRYDKWLEMPVQNPDASTVWFAFPMVVKKDAPFTRRDAQIFLEKRNIQTRVVFTGNIMRQPGFKNIEAKLAPEGYPNADRVMERGFLVAAHHGMTTEMLEHVHQSFAEFASQFEVEKAV